MSPYHCFCVLYPHPAFTVCRPAERLDVLADLLPSQRIPIPKSHGRSTAPELPSKPLLHGLSFLVRHCPGCKPYSKYQFQFSSWLTGTHCLHPPPLRWSSSPSSIKIFLVRGAQTSWTPGVGLALNWPNKSNKSNFSTHIQPLFCGLWWLVSHPCSRPSPCLVSPCDDVHLKGRSCMWEFFQISRKGKVILFFFFLRKAIKFHGEK